MGDLAFGRRRAVSRHPRRVGGELGVQIAVQAGQRVSIASGRYIVAGSARTILVIAVSLLSFAIGGVLERFRRT